jgi:endonuclease/exonuclease/phosphatase family metal-dependent hydrolase
LSYARAVVLRLALLASLLPALAACGQDEPIPGEDLPSGPLTVMTFNVLCSLCKTAEYDPWQDRLVYFEDIFTRHDPDLVGVQELTPLDGEVESLLGAIPGRGAVYFHPPDRLPYPDAAILYRKSRFQLLDEGSYWLSPTPDVPSSTGFASPQLARLVVWARLRDRFGGRELVFIDTHFDNNSPSQELSAPLTLERSAEFVETHPVIFAGDFNSKPDSPAYATLTTVFDDVYDLAPTSEVLSNQEPAPAYDEAQRIDHIFVAGQGRTFAVESWVVDLYVYGPNDRYPSDHFPIVSTFDYQ